MDLWSILADILVWCASVALWLALVNEVCKEVYPERGKPSVPCKALVTWAKRRQREGKGMR